MPLSSSPQFGRVPGPALILAAGLAVVPLLSGCSEPVARIRNAASAQTQPADELAGARSWSRLDYPGLYRVNLGQNSLEQIRRELLDRGFLKKIAELTGVKAGDLTRLRVIYSPEYDSFDLVDYGAPPEVSRRIHHAADLYCRWRAEGYTREFALLALWDRQPGRVVRDAHIRALLNDESFEDAPLPTSLLRRVSSTTSKRKDGTAETFATYVAMDGEIAAVYEVALGADGEPGFRWYTKEDAKDYDPRYKAVMAEVDKAVAERMKKGGYSGLGSCHLFWRWKKEMLEAKGIKWRSPPELNPGTCFD